MHWYLNQTDRTPLSPQYKTLIKTSIGALVTERMFFDLNRRVDSVRSASSPVTNVKVARQRPRMVKCWKCQP